jgi:DNA-binding NtrC family response regulator
LDVGVFEAQQLYRLGASKNTVGFAKAAGSRADSRSLIELDLVAGMALFDGGEVTQAIQQLSNAEQGARSFDLELQFRAAAALFNRQSEFLTPTEALPVLARLRRVAIESGDIRALCGLHLARAKVEACRGNYLESRTHLEAARGFLLRSPTSELTCALSLVDSSLEVLGGNIPRAMVAAKAAYSKAAISGSRIQMAGAAGMLGLIALLLDDPSAGKEHLSQGLELSSEVLYMRLGILDNLAQIGLARDDLDECDRYLRDCADVIDQQVVPCRSWYDLAHQVTRCSVASHIGDWDSILEIVDKAEPEAERRHLRTLRTSLLCFAARAHASMGEHTRSESRLVAAVRSCPRGAVDALISLETATAVCASLRGDQARSSTHFERAIAGARAAGNRLLERQVERDQMDHRRRVSVHSNISSEVPVETERALILADVASLLGGGSSVALLCQKAVALVGNTRLAERLEIRNSSGEDFEPTASVTAFSAPDGSVQIEIRGSDRRAVLKFEGVVSLEEVTLVKSLFDLLRASVGQRSDGDGSAEHRLLWDPPIASDDGAIFRSPRIGAVVREALQLAKSSLPILITGETGTGKDVLARLVHANSAVRRGPYVPYNCSSIPRDLIESQLFGHRRGAFTGATEASLGVVRAAAGGTLFLDEIGDLDIGLQPKLLRFIESGEIHTVGDPRPTRVDVRIIAATHADLETQAAAGAFRRDLFFRLGAAQIKLPPLRERKDEIPELTTSFVARFSREAGRQNLRVSDDLIAALLLYDWPGNIRQLANEMHRIVAMAEPGTTLTSGDLSPIITAGWTLTPKSAAGPARMLQIDMDQTLPQAIEAIERDFVGRAMTASGGRVAEAAQLLGISRKGLFLKRRRWGYLDDEPTE